MAIECGLPRDQGLSMVGSGLEGRSVVEEAHLSRIRGAMEIESQRIKWIDAFMPSGGNADARIREYDDAVKFVMDSVSGAKPLSDYLKGHGHNNTAVKIDELLSEVGKAVFKSLLVPRAVLLFEMNKYEEGMECLGEALDLHGKHGSPDVFVKIGMAMVRGGRYAEAWKWITKAVEMEPDHLGAAYNMALLEDEAGEYYDASETLDWILDARRSGERAEGLPDPDEILLHKGMVHAHEGDHKSAIECYDEVLGIMPGNPDASYCRAESLYRTGACDEAIEWFGRIPGHRDADAIRDRITRMQDEPEERILLPLLVIGTSEEIRGMPDLQHAVFLAQHNLDMRAYDFTRHGFGPYSADLSRDVYENTGLFTVGGGWNRDPLEPRTYSITARGRDILDKSGWLGKAAACNSDAGPALADAAYSVFGGRLGKDIKADIRGIIDAMKHGDAGIPYAHGWVETEADHVEHVLSGMDSYSPPYKSAILNIANIVAHNCAKVEKISKSPVDHYAREDALSTLSEYGSMLMEYGKMHKIKMNPRSRGLEIAISQKGGSSGQGSHVYQK